MAYLRDHWNGKHTLLLFALCVNLMLLHSDGGHVYEGRVLIRDRDLDTYVFADCSSACTTAFIGGAKRYLSPNGRLGFHQHKIDLSAL